MDFSDVCLAYEGKPIAKDINLQLEPGSFTLLLGPSGAGKSTIANLLGGLVAPDSGRLSINDISIDKLSHDQRCSLISMASQDVFLFKASIMDNIRLAKPDATLEEVNVAVRVAQAESFINHLPDGYDTILYEQGVRLSGGEKQRIAIARTLLMNTPVLILDEAMSSLDNITQKVFYRSVRKHYPDKTILVIAHHCYGAEYADQIIILKNGEVSALGNHLTLLADNNFYQRVYQRQHDIDNWSIGCSQEKEMTLNV